MHENAERLIPELAKWNNGKGIDLGTFLDCYARYDHAIAYAALFWPDFVIHDDCVFARPFHQKNYDDWCASCKGDKRAVEAVINHRHIVYIFQNSEFAPTKEIVIHLGRLLKDIWACKLQRDFPDRPIKVEFNEDGGDDLKDYQITFFHEWQESESVPSVKSVVQTPEGTTQ